MSPLLLLLLYSSFFPPPCSPLFSPSPISSPLVCSTLSLPPLSSPLRRQKQSYSMVPRPSLRRELPRQRQRYSMVLRPPLARDKGIPWCSAFFCQRQRSPTRNKGTPWCSCLPPPEANVFYGAPAICCQRQKHYPQRQRYSMVLQPSSSKTKVLHGAWPFTARDKGTPWCCSLPPPAIQVFHGAPAPPPPETKVLHRDPALRHQKQICSMVLRLSAPETKGLHGAPALPRQIQSYSVVLQPSPQETKAADSVCGTTSFGEFFDMMNRLYHLRLEIA